MFFIHLLCLVSVYIRKEGHAHIIDHLVRQEIYLPNARVPNYTCRLPVKPMTYMFSYIPHREAV